MHVKYGELAARYSELEMKSGELATKSAELEKAKTSNDVLRSVLRRRTAALITGFVTLEAKAGFGMAISSWVDAHWYANLGQAVGLAAGAVYLIIPNIKKLMRLSSEAAGGHEEG